MLLWRHSPWSPAVELTGTHDEEEEGVEEEEKREEEEEEEWRKSDRKRRSGQEKKGRIWSLRAQSLIQKNLRYLELVNKRGGVNDEFCCCC